MAVISIASMNGPSIHDDRLIETVKQNPLGHVSYIRNVIHVHYRICGCMYTYHCHFKNQK